MPFSARACVFAVQFSEAVQSMMIFPFLPFMMEGFGVPAGKLGVYAGALSSSYCFASFIATPIVSSLSDTVGMRQTMLFTIAVGLCATLLFGMAPNYKVALVARIVAGSMNGNISILKAFIARTTTGTRRVKAFGLLTLAFGCGAVIAPATGGLLARPASLYPLSFGRWPLFHRQPYLLPCLSCMAVQAAAFITAYAALPRGAPAHAVGAPPPQQAAAGAPAAPAAAAPAKRSGLAERVAFLKKRGPLLACGAYALDCFINVLYDLAVPLLLKSPLSEGGLGLSMRQIGFLLSAASVGLFGSLPLQAPLTQRVGTRRSLAWANFLLLPVFLLLPSIALLRRFALSPGAPAALHAAVFPLLLVTLALINCFGTLGFTLGNVLVNSSVPPAQLAMINGFSQSLSALARGFAPLVGGVIVSMTSGMRLPGGQFVVWAFMGLVAIVAGTVVKNVPPSADE